MRTLGPSAPLECVFLVSVMIVQQLACFPTQPVPRGAWLPSCVLRAVWLGVKSRESSSIVVSEGPSPDDLVGVSLSDELGALGRVEVKAPRCPESIENNLLILKKIQSLDRGQTWCYLGNLRFSNVLSQSLSNLLPRSTPLPLHNI